MQTAYVPTQHRSSQYTHLSPFAQRAKAAKSPREPKRSALTLALTKPRCSPMITWLPEGSPLQAPAEERFRELVKQWMEETQHLSSITEISTHPSYQQIIGMGPAVLPILLRELEKHPNHWFWALRAITGHNPVPDEDRGRVKKMATRWLEWAAANGHRW